MTTPVRRQLQLLISSGLVLLVGILLLTFWVAELRFQAAARKPLPVYGTIADFILTNQSGQVVSLAALQGQVWVADIIFSRCPGPCLGMTRQMKALQQALPRQSGARLVSLTTDPDFDTPAVLKAYAERFQCDPTRWLFLTGAKVQIAALAIDSLKLTAIEKKPEERRTPEDLFIHSTLFVVVDKHAQLRGVFETTGEGIDPKQVKARIVAAVEELERES